MLGGGPQLPGREIIQYFKVAGGHNQPVTLVVRAPAYIRVALEQDCRHLRC